MSEVGTRRNALARLTFKGGARGPLDPILARQMWAVPAIAALGVAASALEAVSIAMLAPLLAVLAPTMQMSSVPGPLAPVLTATQDLMPIERLAVIGALILFAMIAKAVVQIAAAAFLSRVAGAVGAEARDAMFVRLLRADYTYYLSAEPARLMTILTNGTWKLTELVRMTFGIVSAAATIVVFGVLLLVLEWRLFLAVLVGVLLIRAIQHSRTARLAPMGEEVTRAEGGVAARALDAIRSIRAIRLFAQEAMEARRFQRASDAMREAISTVEDTAERLLPTLEVLETALFMVVLLGASAIGTPVPVLATFLVLLYRAQVPLLTINRNRLERAALSGTVKEIEALLEVEPEPVLGLRAIPRIDQPIRFENVSYRFPHADEGAGPAIRDASLIIPTGATVALIGPSGSGKSTLVNLLCGLLRPTFGQVLIGDVPLEEFAPSEWRARIGIAGQDVELTDGSAFDNIAYGMEGATREMVEHVARLADAHQFITAMPAGYDEPLGPAGSVRLSGGQRQRIGLARALVRRPDLLILDEATSAVDGPSERAIMSLLKNHDMFRTAIVISHRRSTLAVCDWGIVVEGGQVVEIGPLSSLRFYQVMDTARAGDPSIPAR